MAFIVFAIWVIPKLWRLLKLVLKKIRAFFSGKPANIGAQPAFAGDVLPSPSDKKDTVSELERLKALLDSGAITQEEFEAAKKKLFGQ